MTSNESVRLRQLAFGRIWQTRQQLVCFLSGPGGSAKSTVIDLVIEYAYEYCQLLGYPFNNAMWGVGATNIFGEFCLVNEDTRMVIVDEISFVSRNAIDRMYARLKELRDNRHVDYGFVHVIFNGVIRITTFFKRIPVPAAGQPATASRDQLPPGPPDAS